MRRREGAGGEHGWSGGRFGVFVSAARPRRFVKCCAVERETLPCRYIHDRQVIHARNAPRSPLAERFSRDA